MTAKELNEQLAKLIFEQGDMPVLVQDSEGNASEIEEVSILLNCNRMHGVPKVASLNIQ